MSGDDPNYTPHIINLIIIREQKQRRGEITWIKQELISLPKW